ncbi:MAG: hypothetical protein Q4E59_03495 [Bacteroidales bacterium]|nr:hypothetical protein [Bacteroidales bacterium]
MAPKNNTAKRTASIREWFTMPLVEKYDNLFKDSGTDFVAIETIVTSGLYLSVSTYSHKISF